MYNIFRKMKSRAGGLVRLRGSVGCAAEYKGRPGDFLGPGPQDYASLPALRMHPGVGCLNGRKSFQGRLYSPTIATP